MIYLTAEPENLARTYYEIKSKIRKLEFQRKNLRKSLFKYFENSKNNEIVSGDVKVYRKSVKRFKWDESKLKPILSKKGLWEEVLSPDNKKIKELIEQGLISKKEIEKAKIQRGSWYVYAQKINKREAIPKENTSKRPETISEYKVNPINNITPELQDPNIKSILITDLSVSGENFVSVHGLDHNGKLIHILPHFLKENKLFNKFGEQIIKPFSVLKMAFNFKNLDQTNMFNYEWDHSLKPYLIRNLSLEERMELMEHDLFHSVEDILKINETEEMIAEGIYLGTIKPEKIYEFKFYSNNGKYEYSLRFTDSTGDYFDLPVTDYFFRRYCDSIKSADMSFSYISELIERKLIQSDVYLRIWLNKDKNGAPFLQITGLYSFPYYK